MFDCLTVCNSACIACIWCILFWRCFPLNADNVREADSSEYCNWKRAEGKNISRFAQCCLSSTETLISHRQRARNSPLDERSENKYKYRVSIRKDSFEPCVE